MANGLTDYETQIASSASSLHVRANMSTIHQNDRSAFARYTGLGNEDTEFMVTVCGPDGPRLQMLPESIRIRHNGTGNFSMPVRFAKLTLADGEFGTSKFPATWARSSATITVTTAVPHGFANNQVLNVTVTSDAAAVPLGTTGIITVLTPTTFTYVGIAAGGATGTLTVGEYISDLRQATATRSTTTLTVTTQGSHGLESNQKINLVSISDALIASAGVTGVITVTGVNTFTVAVTNAGATSGITLTFARPQGNFTPITSEVAYTQAANYGGANVATVSNGPLGLGEPPMFRKADKFILVWGTVTTAIPTTRTLQISGTFRQIA